MKVTVSQLRKIVKEVLEESPPTRRGVGKGMGFEPSADDFPAGVPTQKGMGLEPTVDSLFDDWDSHMGKDEEPGTGPVTVDADIPVDDFGYSCASCGDHMAADQVSCPNCEAMSAAMPKTMRSPGVAESTIKEMGMGQAKASGPLSVLMKHLNHIKTDSQNAQQSLVDVFQQTTNDKGAQQVQQIRDALTKIGPYVDKIMNSLNNSMGDVTQDPWAKAGVRPQRESAVPVEEMKLGLASSGFSEPNLDDLFLVPEEPFERDVDADDDEDRRLDRDPEMQYADLAFDPRRRRM